VARLVDPGEAKISVFSCLAVLDPVDHEGSVSCGVEGGFIDMVCFKGDSLTTEPIADVICVAVEEGDADGGVEKMFEVF
jgi:hypothetical protein